MKDTELKALAKHLSCPTGEEGRKVGELMSTSNADMIRRSIDSLLIQKDENVLEIGHGNAVHVPDIFRWTKMVHYTGLEISETMNLEAKYQNQDLYAKGVADFLIYDGESIPFEHGTFDKVLTVNTIYFWKEPMEFLKEIYRVLKFRLINFPLLLVIFSVRVCFIALLKPALATINSISSVEK